MEKKPTLLSSYGEPEGLPDFPIPGTLLLYLYNSVALSDRQPRRDATGS
jgi:hypothetical protein